MNVIGFDIGNENCVIAAARQNGIDVLLNDESKRETPAIVSFGEKQRFLGSSGVASAFRNPKSTVSQLKRLIGLNFNQANIQNELARFPFSTSQDSDGSILIHLDYLGQNRSFTPVQVLAMFLSHLKQVAEKNIDSKILECVIGIPSYFTNSQRQAYLNAAQIAGLKPLRLIHDCTATALGYGIYKRDPATKNKTYVVFVDIGHCDTQVSVASFTDGDMKILSHGFDKNLGGRDFDEVLFNHFTQEFKDCYQMDVRSNSRACIRLRSACEKVKRVLSANAEAPFNIECLFDERDVRSHIKRDDFEKLSSHLLDRILVPCKKSLEDAGLSVNQIHSVELVGSGSRIPAIARTLATFFKKETSRTLNASECVARGCALQCAMLSPIFRVREYEVQDCYPFSIGLLDEDHTLSNTVLFLKGQPFPSKKMISFRRTSTFRLEAFYADPSELPPGVSEKISHITIGSFQASSSENTKIKVTVLLNLHGIITIQSASLVEDDPVRKRSDCNSSIDSAATDRDFSETLMDAENSATTESKNSSQPGRCDMEIDSSCVNKTKRGRSSRRLTIPVTETIYQGISNGDLSEAQETENKLARHDKLMEQTKERKNALESYVYEIRNKIFGIYGSFATESELEDISRSLQKTEEWLYEDGSDESEVVYVSKLEELKKLVDPIENRFMEEKARSQATKDLLKCIEECKILVKSLDSCEWDMIIDECNRAENWLKDNSQVQNLLPKYSNPVLQSEDIRNRTEILNTLYKQIRGTARPIL